MWHVNYLILFHLIPHPFDFWTRAWKSSGLQRRLCPSLTELVRSPGYTLTHFPSPLSIYNKGLGRRFSTNSEWHQNSHRRDQCKSSCAITGLMSMHLGGYTCAYMKMSMCSSEGTWEHLRSIWMCVNILYVPAYVCVLVWSDWRYTTTHVAGAYEQIFLCTSVYMSECIHMQICLWREEDLPNAWNSYYPWYLSTWLA